MFCRQCGFNALSGAKYCTNCGTSIESSSEVQSPEVQDTELLPKKLKQTQVFEPHRKEFSIAFFVIAIYVIVVPVPSMADTSSDQLNIQYSWNFLNYVIPNISESFRISLDQLGGDQSGLLESLELGLINWLTYFLQGISSVIVALYLLFLGIRIVLQKRVELFWVTLAPIFILLSKIIFVLYETFLLIRYPEYMRTFFDYLQFIFGVYGQDSSQDLFIAQEFYTGPLLLFLLIGLTVATYVLKLQSRKLRVSAIS